MRPSTGVICLFPLTLVSALPQEDAESLSAMLKDAAHLGIGAEPDQKENVTETQAYETQIDLREGIMEYGTMNPGDILESVLRPACQGNGCLDLPNEVKINVFAGDRPLEEKTLIIHAIGDYQSDEADQFIDAIVGAARGAAQCEEKTYTVRPVKSSYSAGRLDFDDTAFHKKATFCKMSNYVKIYRHSAGGDENKHGSIEVTVEYEKVDGFNWCNLFDYASLIPKGDFFGAASTLCNIAKDGLKG